MDQLAPYRFDRFEIEALHFVIDELINKYHFKIDRLPRFYYSKAEYTIKSKIDNPISDYVQNENGEWIILIHHYNCLKIYHTVILKLKDCPLADNLQSIITTGAILQGLGNWLCHQVIDETKVLYKDYTEVDIQIKKYWAEVVFSLYLESTQVYFNKEYPKLVSTIWHEPIRRIASNTMRMIYGFNKLQETDYLLNLLKSARRLNLSFDEIIDCIFEHHEKKRL